MSPAAPRPLDPAAEVGSSGALECDSLSRLYALHARRLLRVAQRIMRDRFDAEDVVHDVFVALCRGRLGQQPARVLGPGWLTVVVRNRALDLTRKRKAGVAAKRGIAQQQQPAAVGLTPEKELLAAQLHQRLRRALSRLPAPQRRTLELSWFEELSQAEIAAHSATPLGTVKSHCRAAQSCLVAALERNSVEQGAVQPNIASSACRSA